MSDTQVDHTTCCVDACPMLAVASRGTSGENWMCFIHVKAAPGTSHAISAELNRLSWLVGIVRGLRAGAGPVFTEQAAQAITLSQRSDLLRKDNEGGQAWMIRLEGVLADSCKAATAAP